MLAPLLALSLAAAPPASPLDGPQPGFARLPGVGRVVQVTGARAYLDAGAEDGLVPGRPLVLWRGDAEIGRCTLEAVAPNHATCTGPGLRAGDAFKLAPGAAAAAPKANVLPSPPSEDELARRAAAVAGLPVTPVEYRAEPSRPGQPLLQPARTVAAEVSLTHATWASTGAGPIHVERAEAAVHGAAVGPGLTLDLDLRAERWLGRATPTFRSTEDTRLYVWQAQVGWQPEGRSLALMAGRILPWTVPGGTVMDGAMLTLRGDGLEGGIFGGVVPEPDTLSPGTQRATGGAFWAWERRLRRDVVVRQEGRVAWVRSPELGNRVELEAGASAHAGAVLDLYGSARLGAGGTGQAPGLLDGARVEVGLRPLPKLALAGGFEYGGLAVPLAISPPALGARTRRADGSAFWDLGLLRVGASGGFSRDQASGLDRSWVGPELQLPRFFTPRLALSAGYLEEIGWLKGRSAFLQAVARPWDRLRLIGRLSWNHEASLGTDQDEVGLYLSATAELGKRFGLRLSALGRAAFSLAGEGGAPATALTANASVYALF
jgi:hypothetical protein